MTTATGSGTRRWRTITLTVRAERRPCHLCHQPIDYTLHWPDPMSYSGDHIIPTNHGGRDTYANCAAAHLSCNCARHDDLLDPNPRSLAL